MTAREIWEKKFFVDHNELPYPAQHGWQQLKLWLEPVTQVQLGQTIALTYSNSLRWPKTMNNCKHCIQGPLSAAFVEEFVSK